MWKTCPACIRESEKDSKKQVMFRDGRPGDVLCFQHWLRDNPAGGSSDSGDRPLHRVRRTAFSRLTPFPGA
jgi:hypothetical protein